MTPKPIRERVDDVLSFDPATGVFTWRVARGRASAGTKAGVIDDSGYVRIKIDGVQYLAHRLAWLVLNGGWPVHEIDHLNGNRADNRPANLRDVVRDLNQQNQRKAQVTNASGLLGVSRSDSKSGYRARIFRDGREVHLGAFSTAEKAHKAYLAAKRELHPGGTL